LRLFPAGRKNEELSAEMPLKNPVVFTVLVLAVLFAAAVVTYSYGLPLLQTSQVGCRVGGGTKTLGCSTSFGTFMIWVAVGVGLAVGGIWGKFGRQ
jgi:hypothetical protein